MFVENVQMVMWDEVFGNEFFIIHFSWGEI